MNDADRPCHGLPAKRKGGLYLNPRSPLQKGNPMSKQTPKPAGNRQAWLLPILCLFAVTIFVYRDLGLRMIGSYLALFLVFSVHLLGRLRSNEPLRSTPITLASALLVLMFVLQILRPDARRDESTLAYFISIMIGTAYILLDPARDRDMRLSGKILYGASMAMAAYVLIFTFLPELYRSLVYPHLSKSAQVYHDAFFPQGYGICLGNYSYTDYVLFLGIAMCSINLAVKPRTIRSITVNGLSLALLMLAMLILGRRGELLATLIAIAVLVLVLCTRRQRRLLLVGGTLLAAAMVGLIILFLPQLKQIAILERYIVTIENLMSGQDISSGRLTLYQIASRAFLEHPIVGIGWDQFYTLVPQDYQTIASVFVEDVHCVYLQFLCETGIVGTVLLMVPICYLFLTTLRLMNAAKHMEDRMPLKYASFSFLLQFFLLFLGLYDPTVQKSVFWYFYALALMFANAAMLRSGWRPTGPMSRALEQLDLRLTPLCGRIWQLLRMPWSIGSH